MLEDGHCFVFALCFMHTTKVSTLDYYQKVAIGLSRIMYAIPVLLCKYFLKDFFLESKERFVFRQKHKA